MYHFYARLLPSKRSVVSGLLAGAIVATSYHPLAHANDHEEVSSSLSDPLTIGDSVNASIDARTGAFGFSLPAIALPGRGMGVSLGLVYRHDQAMHNEDPDALGVGWMWNIPRVTSTDGNVQVVSISGHVLSADEASETGLVTYELTDTKFVQSVGVIYSDEGQTASRAPSVAYSYVLESRGMKEFFDASGRLVVRVDPWGRRADFLWNDSHELRTIIDDAGNRALLERSSDGLVIAAPERADGIAARTKFHIEDGRLLAVTSPDERTMAFGYDHVPHAQSDIPRNVISSIHSASGARTDVSYQLCPDTSLAIERVRVSDEQTGRELVTRSWKPVGENLVSGYPAYSSLEALNAARDGEFHYSTELTDGRGSVRSTYDGLGRIVRRAFLVTAGASDLVKQEQAFVYEHETHDDRVVSLRSSLPSSTTLTVRDNTGKSRAVTEEMTYDDSGLVTHYRAPDGTVTDTRYDAAPPDVDSNRVPGGMSVPLGLLLETTTSGPDGKQRRVVNTPRDDHRALETTETLTGDAHAPLRATTRTHMSHDNDGNIVEKRVTSLLEVAGEDNDELVTRYKRTADLNEKMATTTTTVGWGTPDEQTTSETADATTGLVIRTHDPVGREQIFRYDVIGRMTEQQSEDGQRTYTEHDHNVIRVTTPEGVTTTTYRDVMGRITRLTDNITIVDGIAVATRGTERTRETREVDSQGALTVTDARGRKTRTTADAFGRPIRIDGPYDLRSYTRYDDVEGTQTSGIASGGDSADDAPLVTIRRRDISGREIENSGIRHDGIPVPVVRTHFDGLGRVDNMQDGARQSSMMWGSSDVPVATTISSIRDTNNDQRESENDQTTTALRSLDRWARVTQKDLVTAGEERAGVRRSLDTHGRTVKETDQNGNLTTFSYTPDNLPATIVSPTATTLNTYDPVTRLLTKTETSSRRESTVPQARMFEHDPVTGNLMSVCDSEKCDDTKITYTYDVLGNRLETTYPDGKRITNVYDEHGQKTQSTDIAGNTTAYSYNDQGLLERLKQTLNVKQTQNAGVEFSGVQYEYDPYGRVVAIVRDNGVTTRYRLTSIGEIAEEQTRDRQGKRLFDGQYTYDERGNLIQKTVSRADAAAVEPSHSHDEPFPRPSSRSEITRYRYDTHDQLCRSSVYSGDEPHGPPLRLTDYERNVVGNVTKETTQQDGTETIREFTINDLGQTAAIATNQNVVTQTYDESGNLVEAHDGTAYRYDTVGRQTTQEHTDATVSLTTYWADGSRKSVETKGSAGSLSNTVTTYWDGSTLVNEMYTGEANDEPVIATYLTGVHRHARSLVGAPSSAVNTTHYLVDRHGSVTDLVSPHGRVTHSYDYSDYGAATITSTKGNDEQPRELNNKRRATLEAATRNPFQFSGEYTDSRGSQYLSSRIYVPKTMSFTTRDSADEYDLYSYAHGNPITRVDPTGQSPDYDTVANGLIIGVTAIAAILTGGYFAWAYKTGVLSPGTTGLSIAGLAADTTSSGIAMARLVNQHHPNRGDFLVDDVNEILAWTTLGLTIAGLAGTLPAARRSADMVDEIGTPPAGTLPAASPASPTTPTPEDLVWAKRQFMHPGLLQSWRLDHHKSGALKGFRRFTPASLGDESSGRPRSVPPVLGSARADFTNDGLSAKFVYNNEAGAYRLRNPRWSKNPFWIDPKTPAWLHDGQHFSRGLATLYAREHGYSAIEFSMLPYNLRRTDDPRVPIKELVILPDSVHGDTGERIRTTKY